MSKQPANIRQATWGGAALPHLYSGRGFTIQVDRDAEGYVPANWAVVTITDYANLTSYSVTAEEDEQGRARLRSYSVSVTDDFSGDRLDPVGYLGDRPERSREWLARVAIECARGQVHVAETDDEARLRYVAETVQRCEREGVSATSVLASALNIGEHTVSRRIAKAVEAGLLPPRRRGRPSKPTPKETPDA